MSSPISLRPVTPADAPAISRIVFDAFGSIARLHNFPLDFPVPEAAGGLVQMFTQHPGIYGVAAESDGKLAGSNFLDERSPIRGVGPITVDPAFQGKGAGRALMNAVLERGKGSAGIRLVQDAFNTVSMSLYASVGFEVREPLVMIGGKPTARATGSDEARKLTEADLPACADLCRRIHGFDRNGELADAIKMFGSLGLFRGGRLVAYMSAPPLWPLNHAMAEEESQLTDLILAAGAALPDPLIILIPIRRAGLFRWCLKAGMRVIKPMTLMTIGAYQEPAGAYFPSVSY